MFSTKVLIFTLGLSALFTEGNINYLSFKFRAIAESLKGAPTSPNPPYPMVRLRSP
jgi:hypothetical protein